MPAATTQIRHVLDNTGELIWTKEADKLKSGCSAFKVTRKADDDVLVCVRGVHTLEDPSLGPFFPIDDWDVFAAHGDRITAVYAKAEFTTTTINAGPVSRRSPPMP